MSQKCCEPKSIAWYFTFDWRNRIMYNHLEDLNDQHPNQSTTLERKVNRGSLNSSSFEYSSFNRMSLFGTLTLNIFQILRMRSINSAVFDIIVERDFASKVRAPTVDSLKIFKARFTFCLSKFEELQALAVRRGASLTTEY